MEVVGEVVLIAAIPLALLVERWLGWGPSPDEDLMEEQAAAREAVLTRERLDPVPRSDIEKLLRRQLPVEVDPGRRIPGADEV